MEYVRDTAILPVLTLTQDSVSRALRRSRTVAYLEDRHPTIFRQLGELVLVLADQVNDRPLSIDVNPLAVTPSGLLALDARIQPLPAGSDV